MARHRAFIAGLWLATLAGCGSDGGGSNEEELNLEEQQISASGQLASVAMGPDGRFAVTWSEAGPPDRIQLQRFNADGFKDGPVASVQTPADSAPFDSHLTFGPQGDSFVAFGQLQMYVQRYTAAGSPSGAGVLVHSSTGPGGISAIDFGPAGQGVVLWHDSRDADSRPRFGFRRLAADGSVAGPDFVVASNLQYYPYASTAVQADGSFVVCWHVNNTDPQIQRYTADGTPTGARISVDLLATGRNADFPAVDGAPGGFVAMWQASSGQVEGQRFSGDGSLLGGRFAAGPSQGNFSTFFRFSVGPDGSMVVVRPVSSDGSTYRLVAQRLAADGSPQGAEIPVASGPDIISLDDAALGPSGRFFVTWRDNRSRILRGRLFAE